MAAETRVIKIRFCHSQDKDSGIYPIPRLYPFQECGVDNSHAAPD